MSDTQQDALDSQQEGAPASPDLADYLPAGLNLPDDLRKGIPRLAKDPSAAAALEAAVQKVPTVHRLRLGDAREMDFLAPESVHLVLTSPPYWTLKEYPPREGQLGLMQDYDAFLRELDKVWRHCYRALVPGGRLVCVVGDVCLSRRQNNGRHMVMPLHASIQEHCREIGYDNLAPIIWYKIANASYEVPNGSGFLGKPYEPNAIIKNDTEFILMQRKPRGYRAPTEAARLLSLIPEAEHRAWFRQVWTDVPGESTKDHPAPFPVELAQRLIRMFSFVGDTVLDPFVGSGTTSAAAARWGRHSVGVELDPDYFRFAHKRMQRCAQGLFSNVTVQALAPEAERGR
ncbi:MAG: site-specific DNA-methyltransferase [Candidatus Brocadiia bacterium]